MSHAARANAQALQSGYADAARFVSAFAAPWANPSPAGFLRLFQPEIRLVAALLPETNDPLEAERGFRSLARPAPEPLRREGHEWASHPAGIVSECTLSGQLDKTPTGWRGVDRLILRGGLDTKRIHYFDTTPILLAGGAGELRLFFDTFPIASRIRRSRRELQR